MEGYSPGFDLLRNTSIDILSSSTFYTNSAAIYDSGIGKLMSIILHKGLIIITDTNRHALVVVNVSTGTYSNSSVCTGNSSFCLFNLPSSLDYLRWMVIYTLESKGLSVY